MYELPALNDSIYDEIRAFEPHEVTLSTMFEMAMRNEGIRKLLFLLKDKIDNLSDNMLEEYEEVGYLGNNIGMEITSIEDELYTKYGITGDCYAHFLHTQLLDDYDIETIDDEYICLVNASLKEITEKELNQKIYKPCYLLTDAIIELAIQYYTKYEKRFFKIEPFYNDHYTFLPLEKQKCLIRGHVENDEGKLIDLLAGEPLGDFDEHFLQTINIKYLMDALEPVNLKSARPKLFLPNRQMINMSCDAYISQAENLQQISLFKESFENDSDLIDSISIILEQDESDKVISQIRGSSDTIAKYFFIYDYVKAKLYPDKKTREEYNEKRKEIYTSIEYTYHHKQIQIKTLNQEEEEDLLNLSMNGIFQDISSIDGMNLQWETVRTHYYAMKHYIDELEYKNLRVRNNKKTILKAS